MKDKKDRNQLIVRVTASALLVCYFLVQLWFAMFEGDVTQVIVIAIGCVVAVFFGLVSYTDHQNYVILRQRNDSYRSRAIAAETRAVELARAMNDHVDNRLN